MKLILSEVYFGQGRTKDLISVHERGQIAVGSIQRLEFVNRKNSAVKFSDLHVRKIQLFML